MLRGKKPTQKSINGKKPIQMETHREKAHMEKYNFYELYLLLISFLLNAHNLGERGQWAMLADVFALPGNTPHGPLLLETFWLSDFIQWQGKVLMQWWHGTQNHAPFNLFTPLRTPREWKLWATTMPKWQMPLLPVLSKVCCHFWSLYV